ncbi:MAG: AraC family transcriptional regulator [Collimonas pratensis]|uniref:AraC family transcriptional regulator n=1 Tax=Collimonas pratensis TaxID=279113 RepID=UPI003C708820
MNTLVRAAALTNYFEVAHSLGLNPQSLLQKVGLSKNLLADPDQKIPVSAAIQLLEESAQQTNCPTFGLLMAESRQLSDFGVMSLLIAHQETLKDVLSTLIQYKHLLNESLAIHVEEADPKVIIKEEIVADRRLSSRQAIELALGVLFRTINALIGERWLPLSVNFTHQAPPQLNLYRRIFGVHIEFGSEFNGIVCLASDLNSPNLRADSKMAKYAQNYVDTLLRETESSLASDVEKAIYLSLPSGRATIEQISQSMGMNVRSMQRQLSESGEIFSDLVNHARRDLAVRYMENPNFSLGRVAVLLGYSMPSSFTRWFKAEFGESPAIWRKAHMKQQHHNTAGSGGGLP